MMAQLTFWPKQHSTYIDEIEHHIVHCTEEFLWISVMTRQLQLLFLSGGKPCDVGRYHLSKQRRVLFTEGFSNTLKSCVYFSISLTQSLCMALQIKSVTCHLPLQQSNRMQISPDVLTTFKEEKIIRTHQAMMVNFNITYDLK